MTGVTDPLNRTTSYAYAINASVCGSCHSDSKPTQIILPNGKIIKITYDAEWQKTSETLGVGSNDAATTNYAYDLAGNLASITDGRGKVWTYGYDNRNRCLNVTDPLGHATTWTYDSVGNKLTEKRSGETVGVVNTYDVMNRLKDNTDQKGQKTNFAYGGENNSSFGNNLVAFTDARSNGYIFTYDAMGRKTRMTYPDGTHEDWSYDDTGMLKTYATRAGQVCAYSYDVRNRRTLADWNDATPDVSTTYDNAGRMTTQSSNVSTIAYSYDNANWLLGETSQIAGMTAQAVSYTYHADGNRASMTYPSGMTVTYAYTGRNQLSTVTADGPPPLASYTYDLNGNRLSKTLENGTSASYVYDDANRLVSLDHKKGNVSFDRFGYEYNDLNNRTRRVESKPGGTATDGYEYDAIDQITRVSYGSGRSVTYSYDAVGNRVDVTDSVNPPIQPTAYATANNLNQYLGTSQGPLTYNANSSLESGGGWMYTYDALNRLVGASINGINVSFSYDARNRCVKRVINSVITYNTYDGWNLIEERGSNLALYIHGAQVDEILASINGGTHFYQQDALGSTVALTGDTGTVEESYTYDVYGTPTIKDANEMVIATSAIGNRFLFTGREWINEISLYDYRNRLYSQNLGRFLQCDPIRLKAGGKTLLQYAANAPTFYADPYGLKEISVDKCKIYIYIGHGNKEHPIKWNMKDKCSAAGALTCWPASNNSTIPPDQRVGCLPTHDMPLMPRGGDVFSERYNDRNVDNDPDSETDTNTALNNVLKCLKSTRDRLCECCPGGVEVIIQYEGLSGTPDMKYSAKMPCK